MKESWNDQDFQIDSQTVLSWYNVYYKTLIDILCLQIIKDEVIQSAHRIVITFVIWMLSYKRKEHHTLLENWPISYTSVQGSCSGQTWVKRHLMMTTIESSISFSLNLIERFILENCTVISNSQWIPDYFLLSVQTDHTHLLLGNKILISDSFALLSFMLFQT